MPTFHTPEERLVLQHAYWSLHNYLTVATAAQAVASSTMTYSEAHQLLKVVLEDSRREAEAFLTDDLPLHLLIAYGMTHQCVDLLQQQELSPERQDALALTLLLQAEAMEAEESWWAEEVGELAVAFFQEVLVKPTTEVVELLLPEQVHTLSPEEELTFLLLTALLFVRVVGNLIVVYPRTPEGAMAEEPLVPLEAVSVYLQALAAQIASFEVEDNL